MKPSSNAFAKLFKAKDKQMATAIFRVIFSSGYSEKLNSLLAKPRFNATLKELIDSDFLGRDMEWVLVIPLEKYLKNSRNKYELIFGRGQEIDGRDLFLIWDNEKKKVFVFNLKEDEDRSNVMSLHETYNLMSEYRKDKGIHPHHRPIRDTTIENIKECLSVGMEEKWEEIVTRNGCTRLLIKPDHFKTEIKHLNICINLLRGATIIFLRDVYNPKYSFHLKGKKHSVDYDAYAIVRKFLRCIGLCPERRSGEAKRVRYTKAQKDLIEDSIKRYSEDGKRRSLSEIINEINSDLTLKKKLPFPSSYQEEELKALFPAYFSRHKSFSV